MSQERATASNTTEQFNFMYCAFKRNVLLILDEPSKFPYSVSLIEIESTLNVDIPPFPRMVFFGAVYEFSGTIYIVKEFSHIIVIDAV